MKAKMYVGARVNNKKPTWTAEVIAKKLNGIYRRWRGSGYSTRGGAIKAGKQAALALGMTIEGPYWSLEP